MAAASETILPPFTAFSFEILLTLVSPLPGVDQPVCAGAFSECDGLSLDLEPKSVLQGGANDSVTHLVGQTRPGQVTLRRGMTTSVDLWAWMAAAGVPGRSVTADGRITMLGPDHQPQAAFLLSSCLPVRVRGPALNAQTGLVAIEELGLAVGHLALAGAGAGRDLAFSAGVGFSAGVSVGVSAGAGVSTGAQVSGGLGLSGRLGGTLSASASGSVSGSTSGGAGIGLG